MFCVRCGAANADGSQFCAKCGAAIGAQAGAAGTPVSPAPPAYSTTHQSIGPAESSGKAVASLICGFLFFIFPVAIIGVVFGHLALTDIRKSAGRLTGRGMAIAGLVLGYAGILFIPFVLIVAAFAIPNLLKARIEANESVAVSSLQTIASSTVEYSALYGNGYPPTLETLGGVTGQTNANCNHALLIDPGLASGQRYGYVFSYAPAPTPEHEPPVLTTQAAARGCAVAGSQEGFSVTADPVNRGATGKRSFYMDQTGIIRFENDGPASATSEQLP
jgi:type II secretory pathway pseudopilin PulG